MTSLQIQKEEHTFSTWISMMSIACTRSMLLKWAMLHTSSIIRLVLFISGVSARNLKSDEPIIIVTSAIPTWQSLPYGQIAWILTCLDWLCSRKGTSSPAKNSPLTMLHLKPVIICLFLNQLKPPILLIWSLSFD